MKQPKFIPLDICNYIAIEILEQSGNAKPSQEQIDRVENNVRLAALRVSNEGLVGLWVSGLINFPNH